MLNDLHLSCPVMERILLQSHQRISPAFVLVPDILPFYHCCRVFLLHLLYYQLRISSNKESSNAQIFSQSKSSNQPLILCNIVCSRKPKLNCILQDVTFGWYKYNTNPCCVRQEIMLQLPGHHDYCVQQFLHLWVPCLSILLDLADKVHRLLLDFRCCLRPLHNDCCADYCIGHCYVQ
jgi:hypothetical protein